MNATSGWATAVRSGPPAPGTRTSRSPRLPSRTGSLLALFAGFIALGAPPAPVSGQSVRGGEREVEEAFDSSDTRGAARAAQRRFERRRVRLLPRTMTSYSSRCDEIVGRFCEWYDEGEWTPEPEDPEIVRLRSRLLAELDSLAALIPGDGWVLGQRVWYRIEAGDAAGAVLVAQACGGADPWWCAALEGLALHEAGRYVAAEAAFGRALRDMDPVQALRWRLPRRAVDADARKIFSGLEDAAVDSVARVLDRFWLLADPLYMVEGNDRMTAHYARWTHAELRRHARNPFMISWGRDLEELTVRHGWELWWERTPSRDLSARVNVVGHKHPQGRDFLPPGAAVESPGEATVDDLRVRRRGPRSLYAPSYAPVFLPMDAQVAVFPRGEGFAVVGTTFLPDDTTTHAGHDHPVPWMEAGNQAELHDRSGLWLVAESGEVRRSSRQGTDGGWVVPAPAGTWVVSAESWSPSQRRAGRLRRGLHVAPTPPDVPTLSDLLFVRPGGGDPRTLQDVARRALLRPEVAEGEPLGVVWEVSGLGFEPLMLGYSLSVTREDGNVLRRVGRWLGLVGEAQTLALQWEEPGPDAPGRMLRAVDMDLPGLEAGRYTVRLQVSMSGRTTLVSQAPLLVGKADRR